MTLSGRSFYGPLLKWSLHTWVNLYKDNWLGDVRVCGGGGGQIIQWVVIRFLISL